MAQTTQPSGEPIETRDMMLGRKAHRVPMPELVDIEKVAAHLGVSVRHVRRLVAERRIPYVKWGNLLRFDPPEVTRWVQLKSIEPFQSSHLRRGRRAG